MARTPELVCARSAFPLAGEPVAFASNTLVIPTAPGNPAKVASFVDPVTREVGRNILLQAGFANP